MSPAATWAVNVSSKQQFVIMKDLDSPWRPDLPHNQLPALPPARELESRAVLKACIEARVALAELKQAAELIPNQAMLVNTIPLLEAKDSSEIENIVTTTDQLFQFAQGSTQGHAISDAADPATKEALSYRTALHRGFQSLIDRPLCTATAVDVCRTLKGLDMDIRRTPGTQLINDRTGRVINILYLIQEKLLNLPILYLSRHAIAHKADYYGLLLGVTRDQAWEPWLQFMLKAVAETSRWTTCKIAAIRKLA
jgi:Fic family protein